MSDQSNARIAAVISNIIMWCSAAVCISSASGSTVDTRTDEMHYDAIMITLPVFVTSMIATASFTWVIAKYDAERVRRLDRLEQRISKFVDRRTKDREEDHL